MNDLCSLAALSVGQSAYVSEIEGEPAMCRRLMDLGLIQGTRVTCLAKSPAGDPVAYLIRGSVIALRGRDARGILLEGPVSGPEPRRRVLPA